MTNKQAIRLSLATARNRRLQIIREIDQYLSTNNYELAQINNELLQLVEKNIEQLEASEDAEEGDIHEPEGVRQLH
jgi:ribosome recycling factor